MTCSGLPRWVCARNSSPPLDSTVTETKGTVLLKSAEELKAYNDSEEQALEKIIKGIADAGTVLLHPSVSHAGLADAGMLAALPQSPRYVGDDFDVTISAHTGPSGFALKGWSFFVRYDTSLLTLTASAFSPACLACPEDSRASSLSVGVVAAMTPLAAAIAAALY